MPFLEDNIGLIGCEFIRGTEFLDKSIAYFEFKGSDRCSTIGCGCKTRIKATFRRRLKVLVSMGRLLEAVVSGKKRYCPRCKKYLRDRIPGVLPRARVTEAFRSEVFQTHAAGASIKSTSRKFKVSFSTVDRWITLQLLKRIKETRLQRQKCPKVIGIDEHFFTKRKGYATTLVNLEKRTIFDVKLGRTDSSLESYFNKLEGKDEVKTVCMDLSETYRSIIHKYFPQAKIVADRFHVIRVVFQAFQNVWHSIEPHVRWKRGLGKLFRKHSWNLNEEQAASLSNYFEQKPIIEEIYKFRNKLCGLLVKKFQRGFQMKRNIKEFLEFIKELRQSNFPQFKTLSNTLSNWGEEICRMMLSPYSNGPVEGFHNKMELISRRAYGYRKFENYRRRVLAMSNWDGLQTTRSLLRESSRPPKR
jgi:transposase